MAYNCNYILIDTPGFGDTREDHERVTIDRLTAFLTTNYGIDDLNCVALVAKANQNRISKYQIQMLKEFKSVLGNDIGDITQLLATFASDEATAVIDVVKCAEVQFVSVYQLDNWPLYVSNNGNPESGRHMSLKYRWTRMEEEYAKFFKDLQNSTPASLKKTRELLEAKQCREETKATVINEIKDIVILKDTIHIQCAEINNTENQAESLKEMVKLECEMNSDDHVHNCDVCKQTCVRACTDPRLIKKSNKAFSKSVGGIGWSVTLGAVTGAEVGIFGGPLGSVIGSGIGAVAGLAAGLTAKFLLRKVTCVGNSSKPCTSDECTHKMNEHTTERCIWEERVPPHHKEEYSNLMNTLDQIKTDVNKNINYQDNLCTGMSDLAKLTVKHTNKINELSFEQQSIYFTIDELIFDERENSRHFNLLRDFKNIILSMVEPGDVDNVQE
ncbi:hypothetical protein OTU49_007696 [Cherax quadricarinatus]|uniref:AIG1-type G domain-containing protein n=1 Tax=Cherax quadricarinatus TaxID=27406 RepID=A0AAW0WUF4_CHEQU